MFFAPSKTRNRAKIQNMGVSKNRDHIYTKIKMPNTCQEPLESSKAPYEDLKDMDVLCTFEIKIESQNLDHGYIKDQWPYPNQDQDAKPQSGTSRVLQSLKWGLKGYGCSLYLQNHNRLNHGFIKDQWQYPNQDQDAKPQSGASSIFQSPNQDLKDIDILC